MSDTDVTLGQMIREARERNGWSQADLAERVGVSRVQITRIESGDRGTDVTGIGAFADVLGLDRGDLVRAAVTTAARRAQRHAEPAEGVV